MTVRDEGPAVVQVFLVREETAAETLQRVMREDERQRVERALFWQKALNPCSSPDGPRCYAGIIYLGSGSITFSGKGQLIGHGARHLVATGLRQEAVEAAIIADIAAIQRVSPITGAYWGKVTVQGRTITYRAHPTLDGKINVGTYY